MTYILYPNVRLGACPQIGDFVLVGMPPREKAEGELPTAIGEYAVIRSHTVIYAGNTIGDHFRTGHGVLVREENEIGDNVSIGSHSIVENHVRIGNAVHIDSQVFIPEFSMLEDGCWIGPNVVLTNAKYPLSPDAKKTLMGPLIHSGAKVGANATLLPGVTVGRNALVGAGAVVVSDVPDGKVVIGNPARVVKDLSELKAYVVAQLTS